MGQYIFANIENIYISFLFSLCVCVCVSRSGYGGIKVEKRECGSVTYL